MWRRVHFIVVFSALLLAACQSQNDQQVDRGGQFFDPDQLYGNIDTWDIRVGDCFNVPPELKDPDTGDWIEVQLVPCSVDWQYRALNAFTVESSIFSLSLFEQEVVDKCHRLFDWYLKPTQETWDTGDRQIMCLQERD
jgi:hypothetical protein